jgi:hypothetical protein
LQRHGSDRLEKDDAERGAFALRHRKRARLRVFTPLESLVLSWHDMLCPQYRDLAADTDEVGHAFQYDVGHLFRSEVGHHSEMKPATRRVATVGLD